MKLVTIDDSPDGSTGALLKSGEILHFGRAARSGTPEMWIPRTMIGLLAGGPAALEVVRALVASAEKGEARDQLSSKGALLGSDTRLLAPVPTPRFIMAAGLAYRSHLLEMGNTPAPPHPTAFMKSPHSVAGPGAVLKVPDHASDHLDYEGELALVFGRRCHRVSPGEAMDYVAGYTAANDISARDWAAASLAAQQPWEARLTWEVNLMGKQMPGFTPLGPVLTTTDEVENFGDIRLQTRVNGELLQDARLSDLIFPLPDLISYLSNWYSFEPGDVLLTGTPAGVGFGRKPPITLKAGDLVEVEIDGVGSLKTPVVS